VSPFYLEPGRPFGAAADDPDLLHAAATDPEGFLVARQDGDAVGSGAGVVRGETLQVVHLRVEPDFRGTGVGSALLAALGAYGRSRGARGVELPAPSEPAALAFALRAGIPLATLFVSLVAKSADLVVPGAKEVPALQDVASGAGLTGWVADLDRETRGFARPAEWAAWIAREGSEVLASRRRGRPEAIGAIVRSGTRTMIGPISARTPDSAAEVLTALAARAAALGALRIALTLPVEARLLLESAFRMGFLVSGSFALFSSARHGDFRRYAAAGSVFL
jgi:GNAT superfamily N-acetyltransferase